MEISEKHLKEIDEIMADIECPKDFICSRTKFEQVCGAEDIGLEVYIECSGESLKTKWCSFSLSFGNGFMCKCPLRIYLARTLKI
jgi:hypothetical protein